MGHGGSRKGAGRKSKIDEQALIEKLTPMEDKAFKALNNAINSGESWAVKMYFEYMYGKPKETVRSEVTMIEPPSINFTNANKSKREV